MRETGRARRGAERGGAARDGGRGALEELGLEARVAGAVGLAVHVPGARGVLEVLLKKNGGVNGGGREERREKE